MSNNFRFQSPGNQIHVVYAEVEGATVLLPTDSANWTYAATAPFGVASRSLQVVHPKTFNRLPINRLAANGIEYTRYDSTESFTTNKPGWIYDGFTLTVAEQEVLVDYCISFRAATGLYQDFSAAARNATINDVDIRIAAGDILYFGHASRPFNIVSFALSTAAVGNARTLEYWNGTAWTGISRVLLQGNTNFTATGTTIFRITIPADWAITEVGTTDEQKSAYWIRSRVTVAGSTQGQGDQVNLTFDPAINTTLCYHPFYFSNYGVSRNGRQYDSLLLPSGFSFSNSFNDFLMGAKQAKQSGDISLNNAGGAIDVLTQAFHFPSGRAYITTANVTSLGDETSTALAAFQGDILSIDRKSEETSFQLSGISSLFGEILTEYIDPGVYPKAIESENGKRVPMVFGQTSALAAGSSNEIIWTRSIPGLVVFRGNLVSGAYQKRQYKIARQIYNPFTGLYHPLVVTNVTRKTSTGTYDLIASSNYVVEDNGTLVRFLAFGIADSDEVRFDVSGYADDANGRFTGTANFLIKAPLNIIHFLLEAVLGINPINFDIAKLTRVGATKSGIAGTVDVDTSIFDPEQFLYISGDEDYMEVFHNLLVSFRAYLQTFPLLGVNLLADPTGDQSINEEHLINVKEVLSDSFTYDRVLVKYRQFAAEQVFRGRKKNKHKDITRPQFGSVLSSGITIASGKALFNKSDLLEIETYNTTLTITQTFANRIANYVARGLRQISATDVIGDLERYKRGESLNYRGKRSMDGNLDATNLQRACYVRSINLDPFSGQTQFALIEAE